MRGKLLLILATAFLCSNLHGQNQRTGAVEWTQYYGNRLSPDIGLRYVRTTPKLAENTYLGLGYRSIDWGNELHLIYGYRHTFLQSGALTVQGEAAIYPGLALFRPQSFLSIGLGAGLRGTYTFHPRWLLNLTVGGQFTTVPSYAIYGPSTQWDVPVTLGLVRTLRTKKAANP